jgi:hypothetical protein
VSSSLIGIGEVVLLPLDVLKIKRQTNPEAFRGRGLFKIIKDEGMGLYRGAGWTAARNAPGSFAVRWWDPWNGTCLANSGLSSSAALHLLKSIFMLWRITAQPRGRKILLHQYSALAHLSLCQLPSMWSKLVSRTATSRTPSLASELLAAWLGTRVSCPSSRGWLRSYSWPGPSWCSAFGWRRP